MGCWIETCGITRTPVWPGDPAVMVVLGRKFDWKATSNRWLEYRDIDRIEFGSVDDYGWIEGLEGSEEDGRCYQRAIFFHRHVWDELVGMPEAADKRKSRRVQSQGSRAMAKYEKLPEKPGGDLFWERFADLQKVFTVCSGCRMDPTGSLFAKGSQHTDPVGFKLITKLTAKAFTAWLKVENDTER